MQSAAISEGILDVVRILPDVLFRCFKGDDGKIYWSLNEGGLAQEFGVTTHEIVGKSLDELFPGGASPELHDHFERAFRGERHIFTNEMGGRHFRHFPQAVYDEEGGVREVVGYIADVTDLVEAQQALARANRELDAFVYAASHDMRNPLTALKTFVQLLQRNPAALQGARGDEILQRMSNTIGHMDALIEDYLRMSQVRHASVQRSDIDLTAMARDVQQELEADTSMPPAQWHIQDDMRARVDPGLARTLLQNLMGNAWKYSSKEDPPRIEIRMEPSPEGQVLVVADNGVGFPPDQADALFEAFTRLHDDFPGTGIGLSTVRRIVEHHGGAVWAEGEVGRGARFYVRWEPS